MVSVAAAARPIGGRRDHSARIVGPWAYPLLFTVSVGESSAFLGLVVPGETFVVLASPVFVCPAGVGTSHIREEVVKLR